jgi:hypothetical protein
MMSRSRWAALGDVPVRFWACPIDGHSHGAWSPDLVQTVEWRKGIAYCLTPGCARTSDNPFAGDTRMVVDDGRVWWLLGAESWDGLHLYEARNARSALAEYRRDITAAERTNGLTVRDIRHLVQASHLRVAAGPLTTVEAFQYDLASAYGQEIESKASDIVVIEVACPATPMTAVDMAERIDPAKAAHVRAEVRQRYLPPARRYVATSLTASLTRGEYRILPNDRIRACCLDCGQRVDGATIDPLPPHGCIPSPDPDLEA